MRRMLDGTRVTADTPHKRQDPRIYANTGAFFEAHRHLPQETLSLFENLMETPQFSATKELIKTRPITRDTFSEYLSHILRGLTFEHLDEILGDNYHILDENALVRIYSRLFPKLPVVRQGFDQAVVGLSIPRLMTFRETGRFLQLASVVDVKLSNIVPDSLLERARRLRNPSSLFTNIYGSWQEADGSISLTRLFQSVGADLPNKPIISNNKRKHRVQIATTEDTRFNIPGTTRLPLPISGDTLRAFAKSLLNEYKAHP